MALFAYIYLSISVALHTQGALASPRQARGPARLKARHTERSTCTCTHHRSDPFPLSQSHQSPSLSCPRCPQPRHHSNSFFSRMHEASSSYTPSSRSTVLTLEPPEPPADPSERLVAMAPLTKLFALRVVYESPICVKAALSASGTVLLAMTTVSRPLRCVHRKQHVRQRQ